MPAEDAREDATQPEPEGEQGNMFITQSKGRQQSHNSYTIISVAPEQRSLPTAQRPHLLSPTSSSRSRRPRLRLDRIRVLFSLAMRPLRRRCRLARAHGLDGNRRCLLQHLIFLLHMYALRRVLLLLLHDPAHALCGRCSGTRLASASGCPSALGSALRTRRRACAPVFQLRSRLAFPAPRRPGLGAFEGLWWIVAGRGVVIGSGLAHLWLGCAPLDRGGSWCHHVRIC